MAGEAQAPYREPCGGWPEGLTKGFLGPCDMSACFPAGWKAAQAQKAWHGMFGFQDYCKPACEQGTTKYRQWKIEGYYTMGNVTGSPDNCVVTEYETQYPFSATLTVGRYTGVITVTNCVSDEYSAPIILEHYDMLDSHCPEYYLTAWNVNTPPDPETGCGEWRETCSYSNTSLTHDLFGPTPGPSDHVVRYHAVITLGETYSLAECWLDTVNLLANLSLSDDVAMPWTDDAVRKLYYDEDGARPPIDASGPDLCDYADPNAGNYTGDVMGVDTPEYVLGAPDGAMAHADSTTSVYLQKWCAVMPATPSFNHFRPCGDDRNDARFSSIAWPICGRCAVASATQNGGNVDLVLTDAAPYLQTGDSIDTDGINGLGDSLSVTVTDSTHISVPGTLSGSYTGGGYIWSTGAPSYWWHDDQSKGDYVLLEWEYNPCAPTVDSTSITADSTAQTVDELGVGTYTCTQKCLGEDRCGPPIVAITPSGETFPNGETIAFPNAERELCWQAIAQFTLEDYLWDTDLGDGPLVEARCDYPTWNSETAPTLPDGFTYGAGDADPADYVPPGGCIDSEWI
jgi:hypothetical protein